MADRRGAFRDGVLLSVGTLTVLRVPAPRTVDRPSGRVAMLAAPLAVLPLAAVCAGIGWLGLRLGLPTLVAALLMVAVGAIGTRGLHLDGAADTADGLAASYDRDRALDVMRRGDVGPMGTVTLILLLGLQSACLATLLARPWGALAAGALLSLSRFALYSACRRSMPPARPDGLGAAVASTIAPPAAIIGLLAATGASAGVLVATGRPWWQGLAAVLVAAAAVEVLLRRCRSRLGGVTGDVLGASVEIAFAALLLVAAAG